MENSKDATQKRSFWDTTLGTITKITALLTAITGLILAIKPFLKNDSSATNQNVVDYRSIATDIANQWCSDLKSGNVDQLVSNSSVPFYADNKILNSLPEVRQFYTAFAGNFSKSQNSSTSDSMQKASDVPELVELKIYKLSELKNQGFDVSHDRLFSSLNLEEDPYVGVVGFSSREHKDYIELVFRKTGNSLKVAGWWD